jgi:S-adenosyl-L-methionine hydrolase (adenosine-forming)
LSGPGPAGDGPRRPPTVFFLSDYGLADEFVGVVHAVLHRLVPGVAVVDLTHGLPAFDVRAGAAALERAVPHLGPGVVLAVVDPGVGGSRRGVAVQAGDGRWFVGPDNGLLLPAVDAAGGVLIAVALAKPEGVPATFDGRDVFAPAAAALATGEGHANLGTEVPAAELVRLPPLPLPRAEVGPDGRRLLRTEVAWVDRFGNVQLAVPGTEGPPLVEDGAPQAPEATVRIYELDGGATRDGPVEPGPVAQFRVRRVPTFGALAQGEVGLLSDANGRLAVVVREGSAAIVTGGVEGATVELEW